VVVVGLQSRKTTQRRIRHLVGVSVKSRMRKQRRKSLLVGDGVSVKSLRMRKKRRRSLLAGRSTRVREVGGSERWPVAIVPRATVVGLSPPPTSGSSSRAAPSWTACSAAAGRLAVS
jgi:hypothetical protein